MAVAIKLGDERLLAREVAPAEHNMPLHRKMVYEIVTIRIRGTDHIAPTWTGQK